MKRESEVRATKAACGLLYSSGGYSARIIAVSSGLRNCCRTRAAYSAAVRMGGADWLVSSEFAPTMTGTRACSPRPMTSIGGAGCMTPSTTEP
jgi:hypothetical protein